MGQPDYDALEFTAEEEAEFEGWLRAGKGRLRLAVPEPHSSFSYGDVVINIGTSSAADATKVTEDHIPFQVAPPRDLPQRRKAIDVAVHPSLMGPSDSTLFMRQLVWSVAEYISHEYPELRLDPDTTPERLSDPMDMEEVALQLTEHEMQKGREVLRKTIQSKGRPMSRRIQPLYCREASIATLYPEEIEVLFFEDPDAKGVGVLEVRVSDELVVVLRPKLAQGQPVLQEMCRATYKKKSRRLLIRVYADDIDARAALLQDRLLVAKAKRSSDLAPQPAAEVGELA